MCLSLGKTESDQPPSQILKKSLLSQFSVRCACLCVPIAVVVVVEPTLLASRNRHELEFPLHPNKRVRACPERGLEET